MDYDIIISGAGPAGLNLANKLSGHGLRIALIESQSEAALAAPVFDGREIALTQTSASYLRASGVWEKIQALDAHAIAPLREAKVLNGSSTYSMLVSAQLGTMPELGWLVANHLIRQGSYQVLVERISQNHDITLLCDDTVQNAKSSATQVEVELKSGKKLLGHLLVAADSRFSNTRRAMGIAADSYDFGRNMLVCVMSHDADHQQTAWEWFDYGQTLALLPMNDCPVTGAHRSSVVLTLPQAQMNPLLVLEDMQFNEQMQQRFAGRLGAMKLLSPKRVYPLVAVYPRSMVAQRFACVGDAAVGMHPVTAHGFNFGLLGIENLAGKIISAQQTGQDIASSALLHRFAREHRFATRPLYLATQLIAKLYTQEGLPQRIIRRAALNFGASFKPFQRLLLATLSGAK